MATTASTYQQHLQEAHQRLESYHSRHSTRAASIFLHGFAEEQQPQQWMTLPTRLSNLVQHYQQDTSNATNEDRSITLSPDPMEARRIALTASVVCSAPNNLWNCFQTLFREIIQFHLQNSRSSRHVDDISMNTSASKSMDEQSSLSWWDVFDFDEEELYSSIENLQWLSTSTNNTTNNSKTDILTRPFMQSVYKTISEHVETEIEGVYDQDGLYSSLQLWVKECLMPIVSKFMVGSNDDDKGGNRSSFIDIDDNLVPTDTLQQRKRILSLEEQINHILSDCYCATRQKEIFDIVTDYPDSLPAIIDLNYVLQKTHTMNAFITTLHHIFQKRLLHPGAQTKQILQVYIHTIKVLRIIDPTDCLLEHVSHGIKSYLRERGDTVRCIISSLTDEEALGGDLYEELQRQDDVKPLEEARYDSDEEEEMPGWDWNPSPSLYYQRTSGDVRTIGGNKSEVLTDGLAEKATDLLSMLVGIYGSNDLFVDEYRLMLADKLLANIDFDTDREVHNLELLKIRFGETSMRQCEIMIKDMDDSKRIAANIHSTIRGRNNSDNDSVTEDAPVVDAAIVSHIFWPPLQKESMKNHPRIQKYIDRFGLEYAKYKNPRRLVWFQQLGQVQLELDVIDDGEIVTKEFTCAPLQATLITHFEDNDGRWTAQDLANETGVAEDVIKKKMGLWINNHVIKVNRGSNGETVYELCSHHDASRGLDKENLYDEEDDGLVVSMSGQEEEELSIYESYIVGMLSNLGQLPLERIHNMLKMFVTGSDHKYNKTPQQLSQFLQQLCRDEKIECGADGMYKLVKK